MIFFKKIRFVLRFVTAVIKKQYRMVILGLLLGISFFIFLPQISIHLPRPKKTLKIGFLGQYQINQLPDTVLGNISYGLTKISEKGEPLPQIAERWEVKDDGKKYVFYLKTDQYYWHDGKKFEPNDVNYNFKDVNLEINGNQMIFTLKEPFSPFPNILSKPLFKKGLVGLGDWKVKKIEMNGKLVKSIYLKSANKDLPNKLYRFYINESDLKTAFNLGEIDLIENIFDIEGIYQGSSVKVTSSFLKNAYIGVFFNIEKSLFSEKTFRQALSYALPKETKTRSLGPISPNSWAYNPDVKPYNQDLDHAKKLLSNKAKEEKISIITFPQYELIANMAKENWKKIGIESEIQLATYLPEDYEVLIIAREIPDDPDQYNYWHSTQPGNLSRFYSPRIDKLLEDGRQNIIREERKDIYYDFQRFLVEESPVIFLTHPTVYSIARN